MPFHRREVLVGTAAAAAGALGLISNASAQSYPSKVVRIIVPFPPGGNLDAAPRIVAQQISAQHGWTIVIENRAGAGGQLGTVAGKLADPDGYTLTAINGVTHGSTSAVRRNPGYDPIKDFAPIVLLGDAPLALLVRSDIAARTALELVDLLRKKPGQLNYGSGGVGTQGQLGAAMLFDRAGLPPNVATHVPSKGLAPAITDLLTGNIQFLVAGIGSTQQHLNAGKLRALAVTSPVRAVRLPDVPTMLELGFKEFEMLAWSGVAAPAGTPEAVLMRWNDVANQALANADVQKQMLGFDLDARGGTRAAFATFIAREADRYKRLGEIAGLLDAN